MLDTTQTHSSRTPRQVAWLRVALKWKRVTIGSAAAVLAVGVFLFFYLPNLYRATTVIMPPQASASTASALMSQMSALGAAAAGSSGLGIKNPNDQQIALLKSKTVEDAMINRFDLRRHYHVHYMGSARKKFERRSNTESGLKDGLIRLSINDPDPRLATEMANAWVEEYRKLTSTLAITEASQRRLFYERELEQAKADLRAAEDNLRQTQQKTGVIDIEGQDRTLLASAAAIRAEVAEKQIEIRGMRQFAAGRNPDLLRAEQELSALEGQLAIMNADAHRKSGDIVVPKGNVSDSALDYTRALREVKYREAILDLLTRQFEGAKVDEARQGALIQVIDPASVPERPATRLGLMFLALLAFLAVPAGVAVAQGVEWASIAIARFRANGAGIEGIESLFSGAR